MSRRAARDTVSLSQREIVLCKQFSEFTSASQEVAAVCLGRFQWNIHNALEAFWENPAGFVPPPSSCDVGLLETMFNKYKEEDEDAVGVDGLIQFCTDLDVPPDDMRMLVFCFNLQEKIQTRVIYCLPSIYMVSSAVRWTKQEFIQGLIRMGCDSIPKIVGKIPSLRADLVEPHRFKQFYAFTFDVSKQDGQKVLDLGSAVTLWRMVLGEKFMHLDLWCDFLQTEYKKSITKDTWMLTLEFALQADTTMSNIDLANSAWPVVIDEFVEYYRSKNP